jgi:hypothetical protein
MASPSFSVFPLSGPAIWFVADRSLRRMRTGLRSSGALLRSTGCVAWTCKRLAQRRHVADKLRLSAAWHGMLLGWLLCGQSLVANGQRV